MKVIDFLKNEFKGFSKTQIGVFACILILIAALSFITSDSKIALVSAVCGITYTTLAGYGKVSAYFIGIIGTVCYCIIAYKSGYLGQLALYGLYYFPMQIVGIFKWLSYYKKDKSEIIKTQLTKKERFVYFSLGMLFWIGTSALLRARGGNLPYVDAFTVVFSILGLYLTVRRCIEQWYIWSVVNFLSFIMWFIAWQKSSDYLATVCMWGVYFILSLHFLRAWKKELELS